MTDQDGPKIDVEAAIAWERAQLLDELDSIANAAKVLGDRLQNTCRALGHIDGMQSLVASIPFLYGAAGTCRAVFLAEVGNE